VWPHRPDLLIRIDFLEWYREEGAGMLPNRAGLSAEDVERCEPFFRGALAHPYFVQHSRKARYRRKNLTRSDSEQVYAKGIAAFLNLLDDIQRRGFDPDRGRMNIKVPLFVRSRPRGMERRRAYIGNGCHRFACLSWLHEGTQLPADYFAPAYMLSLVPLDWVGIFLRLGVLDEPAVAEFDALFAERTPEWRKVLDWGRRVRDRFAGLDLDEVFAVRFGK
jgi:hypothetical protein